MGRIVDIHSSCRYPATEFEDTGVCSWNGVNHVSNEDWDSSPRLGIWLARQNVSIVIVAKYGLM